MTGEYVGDGVTGLAAADREEADLAAAEVVDRVALGDPDRLGRFALLGPVRVEEAIAVHGVEPTSFAQPRPSLRGRAARRRPGGC